MNGRSSCAALARAVLIAVALAAPAPAGAQLMGHPTTGAAIVTHGAFINVYVYPNSDTETWEQHLAGLADPTIRPTEDFSRARIDAFTAALMSGWPGYFDALMQYRTIDRQGIAPPTFYGSKVSPKYCVDAMLQDVASNGVVNWGAMRTLANCYAPDNNPAPQVNLILSPDIKVSSPSFDAGPLPDMCTTSVESWHSWGVDVPNFSVAPTNRQCNATFADFTAALSHEIVEIVTDPAGLGYLNGPPTPINYDKGEMADLCEASSGARENPSADPAVAFTFYGGYTVARYWSDFDMACVPRMESPAGFASALWVLASGDPLVRLTGDLRDFDIPIVRTAPDLPITQLRLFVQTGSDDLRGDQGNLASATVHFRNGDQQTADISGSRHWNNFETHDALLKFPPDTFASSITGITLHKDYDGGSFDCCGDNWNVEKVALMVSYPAMPSVASVVPAAGTCDGTDTRVVITGTHLAGGRVQAVPQAPNLPAIPLPFVPPIPNPPGHPQAPNPPNPLDTLVVVVPGSSPPGVYELVVTTPAGSSVQSALSARTDLFGNGPSVYSLDPASGPVPGGTLVTLTGQCFDAPGINPNAVQVSFGALPAAKGYDQCQSATTCIVASPPVLYPSEVDVTVSVNGATSKPTPAASFRYQGPQIDRLTPNHGPRSGGTDVEIDGSGFPPYLGTGLNLPVAFGTSQTAALCLGSTAYATTSCTVTSPPAASTGPVQVVGTAFGTTTPQTAASVFTFDDFPQIAKLQLPGAGVVEQRGVFLNGNAPGGGAAVGFTSDDPRVVRPPAMVIVPAGQQMADVPATVFPSPVAKTVTVTASYQGSSASTTVSVDASPPLAIGVSGWVATGSTASLTVTLNRPATGTGVTVALRSADPVALPLPKSVLVPRGSFTASVPLVGTYRGKPEWVDVFAQTGKAKAQSSAWLSGAASGPPACKPRICQKGYHFDTDQCLCVPGVPQ